MRRFQLHQDQFHLHHHSSQLTSRFLHRRLESCQEFHHHHRLVDRNDSYDFDATHEKKKDDSFDLVDFEEDNQKKQKKKSIDKYDDSEDDSDEAAPAKEPKKDDSFEFVD